MTWRLILIVSIVAFGLVPARIAQAEDFAGCLALLRPTMIERGVSGETFDRVTQGLQANDVVHFQNEQPEFTTPIWDYMAALVDDQRISDGRDMLAKYSDALDRIEARFGVDRQTLVAFWGVESDYGRSFGARPVVQSLATLSCFGDKASYFRSELSAALTILQRGDVRPENFNGSWAGAFGHTQFMPSTFLRNAIDMEGDGHPNIIDSVPDALGSTANYLRKYGWVPGLSWGHEVKLPAGYAGGSGRKIRHPMAYWSGLGIIRVDGAGLGSGEAALLLPAGPSGPAFLVTRNFDAIYAYNAAESYSLSVAHLSDRLRGAGPFVTPWPTDDPGLSRAERRETQQLLQAKGYDIGNIDGVMGTKSRDAIKNYQQRLGLTATGRAGASVLRALRDGK